MTAETRKHPETGENLRRGVRAKVIRYGSLWRRLEVPGWYPANEGDALHTGEDLLESDRVFKELRQAYATRVRQFRKKVGLSQAEAGKIIGGGVRAFQKYESGKVPPSDAAVALIELLIRHPEEIEALRRLRDGTGEALDSGDQAAILPSATNVGRERSNSKRNSYKQFWVENVEFIFLECVRIQNDLRDALDTKSLDRMPKADLFYHLYRPDGSMLLCGQGASNTLWELSKAALNNSRLSRRVALSRFRRQLFTELYLSFVTQRRDVSFANVDRAVNRALTKAEKTTSRLAHLIPCRLMHTSSPSEFRVGPVLFRHVSKFPVLFQGYERHEELDERMRSWISSYYEDFSWFAEVAIDGCDAETSQHRATQCVGAAVDFLHVLFGPFPSRRMVVGGPALGDARTAALAIDTSGRLSVSIATEATSAVGIPDDWPLEDERQYVSLLMDVAGQSLLPIANPGYSLPLARRFTEAAGWYGQAVRHGSPAASIILTVTALEQLVATGRAETVSRMVSERAAALLFIPDPKEPTFDELVVTFSELYDLRSRLTHGSISPIDFKVEDSRASALQQTRDVLLAFLEHVARGGAIQSVITPRQLETWFDAIVGWCRDRSSESAATPSRADD